MFGLQFVNEVENVQREMDQLFRGFGFTPAYGSPASQIEFQVSENATSHIVKAMLPGLDREKLSISILGRCLTVSGEFFSPEKGKDCRWHRQERRRGNFEQNIQLASNLEIENIEAEYVDGILNITLPKAISALPKKIAVKID